MTAASPSSLSLQQVEERALRAGLNLAGHVTTDEFDRAQPRGRRAREVMPECGDIIVLGTGGSAFWRQVQATPLLTPGWASEPMRRAEVVVADLVHWLAREGIRAEPIYPRPACRQPLNFIQLAEMAGLGYASPVIPWLLHPRYGPWINLRCALLVAGSPFAGAPRHQGDPSYQPCVGCSRPCLPACPAEVFDGRGGGDLVACATHRHRGGCAAGCAARRACPQGMAHRFDADEEFALQQQDLSALRRDLGLGWWQLVPLFLRRG
jgi:hypothetical protein